jgi:hypothetical protein
MEYLRPMVNFTGLKSAGGGELVISPAIGLLFSKSSSKWEARAGAYRNV